MLKKRRKKKGRKTRLKKLLKKIYIYEVCFKKIGLLFFSK